MILKEGVATTETSLGVSTTLSTTVDAGDAREFDLYLVSVTNNGGGQVNQAVLQGFKSDVYTTIDSAAVTTALGTINPGSTATYTTTRGQLNYERIRLRLKSSASITVNVSITPYAFGAQSSATAISTDVISETTAATGVTIDGVLLKDGVINFSGVSPSFTSQEAALINIGTYTSAITIADTGASFIPIQVNLSSTGNAGTAGNQVAAARLRVDSDTANQANTAIHCLQLRSDISTDVYAAACLNASLNVSAATSLPTATMQGIYVAITGTGAINCPNNVNVLEAVYKQTSGGSGVDNTIEAACNASGCALTNIIAVTNYAGTVTNGIKVSGQMTNGILVSDDRTGTWSGSVAGIRSTMTSSATAGIGNMYAGRFELIQSALPSSQGHTTALYVQTTVTGSTNNPTSVMSLVLAGGSGGNTTPFINFIDASTDKTLHLFEIGTGGAVGNAGDGTELFETSAAIGNVNEITHGLRVKVNGSDYYILMATQAAVAS